MHQEYAFQYYMVLVYRLETAAHVSESSEELLEEMEENVAEHELEELTENRKQSVQVQQLSEKQDDKEVHFS